MSRLLLFGLVAAAVSGCAQTGPASPVTPSGAGFSSGDLLASCTDGTATPPGQSASDLADGPYACSGVDLVARVPLDDMEGESGNDIWGWTDPQTGKEYALVGLNNGTFFVDVSDPVTPALLGKLPTATVPTTWRDIKVYQNHAFVVSEARDHGMQVFDLTRLRGLSADPARRFEADARYTGIANAHNIVINEETGFAYAVGARSVGTDMPADCAAPGFHVINIETPTSPTFAGCFSDARKEGSAVTAPGYTHDGQCIVYDGPDADYAGREICSGSNEDVVTFFDVTDKANVRIISQAEYPRPGYTHQGWFTEDRRFFLANDELDEMNGLVETQRTLLFNTEDLDNPEFIDAFDSGLTSIDHNLYVVGTLSFQSNYESGLRIVDHSRIAEGELREVAFFDTYPQGQSAQFNGQWSNYPYFGSGYVIANDINNGLFILRPSAMPVVGQAR